MSELEIAANIIATFSIWLAARNSVYTWPTGVAGCTLFGVVFYRSQLYADATLQLFFIGTSLAGWWQWFHPKAPNATGQRPVTRARLVTLAFMLLAGVVVTAAYGGLLHRLTNAFMPYMDAAVLALSVIAQCLLMQRKIDTWPFWLGVDTLSVGLFASRGLRLTAIIYAIYWLNACYGWWRWHKEQGESRAVEA